MRKHLLRGGIRVSGRGKEEGGKVLQETIDFGHGHGRVDSRKKEGGHGAGGGRKEGDEEKRACSHRATSHAYTLKHERAPGGKLLLLEGSWIQKGTWTRN